MRIGQRVPASAPDMSGRIESWGSGAFNTSYTGGCFYTTPNYPTGIYPGDRSDNIASYVLLSASRSSSVYSDSATTITTNSINVAFIIRY